MEGSSTVTLRFYPFFVIFLLIFYVFVLEESRAYGGVDQAC